jgi:transposase InsO family protein
VLILRGYIHAARQDLFFFSAARNAQSLFQLLDIFSQCRLQVALQSETGFYRIQCLSLANCYFAHNSSGFPVLLRLKQRNPNWGCPRIAQQIALAFHIPIDKDLVRRILAHHYLPGQDSDGPSWLTFLGHMKDSLWSIDLFRCESATLRTHWVLVVMDQYTRRIIGFGVHAGTVDGVALCRMFNRAIRGQLWMPNYLSSDNDPLYRFHQWQANLRILEVTEIKSIPYVPLSHPFVERLIGTLRREYLDHTLFWTTADLENKLLDFRTYFNNHRTHTSLEGRTPDTPVSRPIANLRSFRWQPHCRSYIRHQWLPDLSKTRARCGVRSTSAKTSHEIVRRLRC